MKTDLTFYYDACNLVARKFTKKYFKGYPELEYLNDWWVAGNVGTIIFIGDYFFDMENMVEALERNVSDEVLFDWYDWMIDPKRKGTVSLHYYINLKAIGEIK